MRTAILYAGTIVAVVQIFYLAQLAAQHSEPTIDADAAIAEAFERRPLHKEDYAAPPRPASHDEPVAAHAQPHDYAARDALLPEFTAPMAAFESVNVMSDSKGRTRRRARALCRSTRASSRRPLVGPLGL